jgi:hypothetical protein
MKSCCHCGANVIDSSYQDDKDIPGYMLTIGKCKTGKFICRRCVQKFYPLLTQTDTRDGFSYSTKDLKSYEQICTQTGVIQACNTSANSTQELDELLTWKE